ncbi:SusF/SusE family outer membrane protein [Marinilabiliaceae bacterium ANBcel2]|nr:SusF/SusE family outer membrane protein [Marinilabiliaceae bacterium ANBcel2]
MKMKNILSVMKYAFLFVGVALFTTSCSDNEYDIPGGTGDILLMDGFYLSGEGTDWPQLTKNGALSRDADAEGSIWEVVVSAEEDASFAITGVDKGEFKTYGPGSDMVEDTFTGEEDQELWRKMGSLVESTDHFYFPEAGSYKVVIDANEMHITITAEPEDVSEELYMIGETVGDWDWDNTNLPMIQVHSNEHLFWKIVWMDAGTGGFKFAPERGWGNDFGMDEDLGEGEFSFGGDNIDAPETSGYYMVVVDMDQELISVANPEVYLIGNTVGSWDTSFAEALFTVDNSEEILTLTIDLQEDELRMYAWHAWFSDWWQSEFMIFDGNIEFRGTGDDQDRVSVDDGVHTINLDFRSGTGEIIAE